MLLRLNQREDAIKFLEKAYEIYAATKHNDDLDKAEMANQIATLLHDFGSHRDAIDFALRSNSVYLDKKSLNYISKVMQNNKIIAEAKNKLGAFEDAIRGADDLYNNVTNEAIWNPDLGGIVVASTKISFEALVRKEFADMRSRLYYVLDMIDESHRNQPFNMAAAVGHLKDICEANKTPSFLLRKIFSDIRSRPSIYCVDNLVNVNIEEFLSNLAIHQQSNKAVIRDVMEALLTIYQCVGADFLLSIVRPNH